MPNKKNGLPMDAHLDELCDQIRNSPVTLVAASPGSGKTTRLPPALTAHFQKQVLVLEPRRIAAVTAAHRIAEENAWSVGREVGYQIRFEDKSSAATRLMFVTEALLQKKLLKDPLLERVDCVVLDEFHERSLHTDTAFSLLLELQENFRPDLRIVVMSATLQIDSLRRALPEAEVFEVTAPPFPLEIRQDSRGQILRPGPDLFDRVKEKVIEALRMSPGQRDVLVFLPGVREISEVADRLNLDPNIDVLPLHAQLPVPEQLRALKAHADRRRVILATNVAESSLTLDGVDTVIDSGLERIMQKHHRTGFPSLELVRISKASATQRAGRAARQGPGLCLQLWSAHEDAALTLERPAEIHRTELSELTLLLSGLGVTQPQSLKWIDPPSGESWQQAQNFLRTLQMIDEDCRVTPLGARALQFPLHPRWAKLLLTAEAMGAPALGAKVAAVLQNWGQDKRRRSDLRSAIEDYERNRTHPQASLTRRTEEQLLSLLSRSPVSRGPGREQEANLESILWQTFPDRLCRKRDGQEKSAVMVAPPHLGRPHLSRPRGVRLPEGSWHDLKFFLALEVLEGLKDTDTQCSLLFPLSEGFARLELPKFATKQSQIVWSEKEQKFWNESGLILGGIWLENPHRVPAKPEEIGESLIELAMTSWDDIISRNAAVSEYLQRYFFYLRQNGRPAELSAEQTREVLTWACQNENSITRLYEKDFTGSMGVTLLGAERENFERLCPKSLQNARGRHCHVTYSEHLPPHIEVRIQDAFHWRSTPMIMGVPVLIDLLAPNGRPAQRTQDLKGFWASSYLEIRKELRARYPRQPWPEDPFAAPTSSAPPVPPHPKRR